CEERVERGRLEDRAETVRGEIEHAGPHAEPDPRRIAAGREDAEADSPGHAVSSRSASRLFMAGGSSQRALKKGPRPSDEVRGGMSDPCPIGRAARAE